MIKLNSELRTSDSVRICYRVHHGSKKEWIVFLHGYRVNSSVWTDYLTYFEKKGYSTIVMDLRGHGQSGRPRRISKYRLSRYSKDLHQVIKRERISNFVLVGYSMGGTIVLDYYGRYPIGIKKLVLISTSCELRKGMRKRARVLFPIAMTLLDSIRALYSKLYKKEDSTLDFSELKNKDGIELLFELARDNTCRLNLPEFASLIAFSAKKASQKVKVPTLIIGGDSDELFSINSFHELNLLIPDSKLKIFKGTHCLVFSNPKPVINSIDKFLH